MRIVVTGGTSSVACSLKPKLAEFSEVITAGRKNCDIVLDLSNVEAIALPLDIDTIVHTAANFGGNSDAEILEAEMVNAIGTLKLCQAAVKANVKHFVLISSIYTCLDENSDKYSIYALSKKHSEEIARFYCSAHSLPLTILRPAPIYGNENSFRKHQPFFYNMIDKAEAGEDITLYGSHDPLRNYIHVEDLTTIIVKVIENKVEGTYSCAQTTDVTYSQIAKAALEAFQSKGQVQFLKNKPDIPDMIFPKEDFLYEKIKFYPKISIEEGMSKIANYRKKI